MKFVKDGVRYHVDKWGNGYPLLLLHGFTGSAASWREFEAYLKERKVMALDIIGHGQTDSPEQLEQYDMEEAAETICYFLKKEGIEQTDILGYSMGGRLALTFAVQYPNMVRKLILESASPGLETEADREERRKNDKKLANLIKSNGIAEFVEYWENIPLFASQRTLPLQIRKKLKEQRIENKQIGLINSLLRMGTGSQPSWWEALPYISADVLLITGSLDEKFCSIAEKMQQKIPNCRLITAENAGHAIHVEKCDFFGTIVKEFLSE